MTETEYQCRRVCVGKIDQVRPGLWMLEIEGQQVGR